MHRNNLAVIFQFSLLRYNINAGISVAIITVPQALAYATLAGLPPEMGLYAAAFPTIIAALAGSSHFLITGPVAVISLLTFTSLEQISPSSSYSLPVLAMMLALIVGVIQLLLSFLSIGSLIKYIARTVVMGFTNAAALIIGLTQIPALFGTTNSQAHHPLENLGYSLFHLDTLDITTFILGIGSLAGILLFRYYRPKLPITPIIVCLSILLSYLISYSGPTVGVVPSGIPSLQLHVPNTKLINLLWLPAFLIAILGYMEGTTVAKSLASKYRQTINPNRELLAQGLANIISSVTGGFPVSGSLSRTALNHSLGATHWLSGIIAGLGVLATLLFLTPSLSYLPQATLAAIIISAVISLINLQESYNILFSHPRDGIVSLITFLSTLIFAPHLQTGLVIGVIVSIIVHMHRTARPHIQVLFLQKGIRTYGQVVFHHAPKTSDIMAVIIDWSLTFTNAPYIEDTLLKHLKKNPQVKHVLIMARSINHIDYSAEEVVEHLTQELSDQQIHLYFSGLHPSVKNQLEKSHFFEYTRRSHVFTHASNAISHINQHH